MKSLSFPTLRRRLALALSLAVGGPAAAQGLPPPAAAVADVRRLTLDEARQLALANNKSLILGRLNVEEKGHVANAARKDYYPKLLGSVTYLHFDKALGQVTVNASGRRGILAPGTQLVNVAVSNQNTALSTLFVAQPITKLIAVNALVQIGRADQDAAQAQLDKGTRDLLS